MDYNEQLTSASWTFHSDNYRNYKSIRSKRLCQKLSKLMKHLLLAAWYVSESSFRYCDLKFPFKCSTLIICHLGCSDFDFMDSHISPFNSHNAVMTTASPRR